MKNTPGHEKNTPKDEKKWGGGLYEYDVSFNVGEDSYDARMVVRCDKNGKMSLYDIVDINDGSTVGKRVFAEGENRRSQKSESHAPSAPKGAREGSVASTTHSISQAGAEVNEVERKAAKPTEKERVAAKKAEVAAKKAELALKAATADELQKEREQQRQKAEMERRQNAPVRLRGERKGMAETGQSLMDLGGAEGEDLFNRTIRTEEKSAKPTEKERVAAKKAEAKAPPAEAQTAKSGADSAAETSASGGETARARLEAAWEEWAGDEELPKWADGLDEAHTAEYARLVKAASDTHSETSSPNRPEKLALDRFEETHGRSFRPAAKAQAKPTEKERVAAKKAEVAEKKAQQAAGVVFRNGDDVALVQDGERVTGKVMRSPDGTLAVRVKEKVARSAAHPDGVQVRDVPVKDRANLTKLIDNGGMRFKRGAADFDKENGTELASVVSLAQAMRTNDEKTIAGFRGRHFRFAKTNDTLKGAGLSGDYFTIRAGVILRHNGKDAAHDITPDEWGDIADALTNKKPEIVERFGDRSSQFRIWTQATIGGRVAIVGAEVKNIGRDIDINAVQTVFGVGGAMPKEENIVYPKSIEEKRSVLTRHNSGRYTASPQDGNSISQTGTGSQTGREEPRGVQKRAGVEYPDAGREISGIRFKVGAKRREEYARQLAKHRPDLDANAVLDELDKFDEPKKEKVALHWVVRGAIRLPEDAYKVEDALSVAEKAKVDPFAYKSPLELIEAHKDIKPTRRAIDPATVPELSDRRDEGDGIVSYEVADTREGQAAMRRIIDTHWGEDANPWCLLARYEGKPFTTTDEFDVWSQERSRPGMTFSELKALEEQYEAETGKSPYLQDELADAWGFWQQYSALPKRVAFKNGRLLAFMATEGNELPREAMSHHQEYLASEDHRRWDMPFDIWLDNNYPESLDVGPGEEWWDRKDESHPDLDWARGGASGLRFKVGGVYTGSAADYANRSRQGGVDDGPSIKHIGTGEGSNVYGWGLYGSTVRGVAEKYARADRDRKRGRRTTLKSDVLLDGKPIRDNNDALETHGGAIGMLEDYGSIDAVLKNYEFFENHGTLRADERSDYEWLKANRDRIALREVGDVPQHLYEQTWFTNRAEGDESHLLKWYEPVDKKTWDVIRETERNNGTLFNDRGQMLGLDQGYVLEQNGKPAYPANVTGERLYNDLAIRLGSPKAASEFLYRAGIDGVKYPVDSYGKTVKDGDKAGWNYVAFSDEHIRVDHKWTDGQMRFKIAGARGAANLGITNLGDAERMEQDGARREDIWRKTGWWRGRDGKWRVELPDIKPSRGIVLNPRTRRFQDADGYFFSFRLGELVDGGETNKAYPGLLDDITVHFRHGMPSYKASYAPESNTIELSSRFMRKSDVYADEPTITLSPEATTLIAHELQHAIQRREGFAIGANADKLNWTEYRNTMGEVEARNVQTRLAMSPEERAATPPWETEDVPEDRQTIRFKRSAGELQRDYDEVVRRYTNADGTKKRGWMRAPNGQPTKLTERQWVQVRTPAFKEWFGDWERNANIEKLKNAKDIEFKWGNQFSLDGKSARRWLLDNIRGEYENLDTGDTIHVVRDGVRKVTSHSLHSEAHLKSTAAIPQIIRDSVFITELDAEKENANYDKYRYYVAGIEIDGVPYTVKMVVGLKGRDQYYDHDLTQIRKGNLLEALSRVSDPEDPTSSLDAPYDTKLRAILQPSGHSRVVDENGEPLVVYRRDNEAFNVFDVNKAQQNDAGWLGKGFYFYGDRREAESATGYGKNLREFYLKAENPYYITPEEYNRLVEADDPHVSAEFAESLREEGYDSVYWNGDGRKEWMVLEPTQIKSATDNTGAFDGTESDIRFKRGANERAAALTEHVKYGKIRFVNHERLTNVIRGLVAGELKHPRFTKEEVAASKGTEHERLWSYILSLESSGADAGRSEGSATRTGAATAQIRGGLDRLGSLATRYGRDPRDIIAEKGRFFDRGAESRVYLEENSGKVVKVRELKAVDTGGAVDVLANIVYHNYLFPKDAYSLQDIVVWNKNGYDQFDLILEQPFVTPKTDANGNIIPPSEEQIIAALRKTPQRFSVWDEAWDREDSDEDSDGDFSSADFVPSARKIAYNGDFMVYDFKPGRNTFIDAETGEVRFIDPRIAINDPGMGFPVSRFGKRRIDRRGFDLPPSSEEDGSSLRFKRGANERPADDTSVWFGAGASMAAHGFDVHTAKELGLNITDKDTVAAANELAADVRRMAEIEKFALTNNRPLAAEEVVALAILTKNLNIDLGRINKMMAESANAAAFQAEKELVETRLNKAQEALNNAASRSGQTMRALQIGVADDVRDSEIYILRSIKAERRKQGTADDDVADTATAKTMHNERQKLTDRIKELEKQVADLSQSGVAEKRATENVGKARSAAKQQAFSPERKAKAAKAVGFEIDDEGAALLDNLDNILGSKGVAFKSGGDTASGSRLAALAPTFAALAKKYGYDKAERAVLAQHPEIKGEWAEFRRQNEKKSAEDLAKLALPVTKQRLVTTRDLDEAREECKRQLDENAGSPYQQRIAIGHYLRRYMDALINENPDVPMKELQEKMAEEATDLTGTKHDPVAMLAVMAGVDGYDLETRAEILRKIAKARHAMQLFREGKVNEAARESGLLYEDEATALDQLQKTLEQIIMEKQNEIDYLSTFSEKNAGAIERVKQLKADLKEAEDTLALMHKQVSLAERKAKFAEVLEKRIAETQQTANALRGEVESDEFKERKEKIDAKIAELKAALAVAKRDEMSLKKIQDKIAEYEKRIADGDYDRALQTYRANDAKLQAKLALARERRKELRRKHEAAIRARNYREMGVVGKTLYGTMGILGEMKGVVASFDLSSVLRQGGQLSWAHPFIASKNLKTVLAAMSDEKKCDELMAQLRLRPNWKYYEQAGVEFTDYGEGATNKEDVYLLNQYRRITNAKLLKAGVQMSERAFTTFLNLMRADVFDAMVGGSTFGSATNMNDSQLKAIGRFINIASQRGTHDMGVGLAAKIVNTLLWSPRNVVSRFQFLWETGKLLGGGAAYGDKTLRSLFAKELVRYIGGMSAGAMFLKAVAELFRDDDDPPNEMEFDPRSSDFLKVRFGNVRVDLTSGLTPILVFGARFFSRKSKNTRGQTRDFNAAEGFGKFLRQKFSPSAAIVWDLVHGEDFEKRDIDWTSLWEQDNEHVSAYRYLLGSFAPLSIADLIEQAEQGGLPKTFVTGAMSLLGANVQAFDPYNFKQLKGDYTYFRGLYDKAIDPEERRHLLEYHPMLKRRSRIESALKRVRDLENIKKKAEKKGYQRLDLDEPIKRAKEVAIGIMAGID